MPKSFGGEFPALAQSNNDHIWSWFTEPDESGSDSAPAQSNGHAQNNAHGHNNAHATEASTATLTRAPQLTRGDFDYPLGNQAIDESNSNILKEVLAAQLRLREQRVVVAEEAEEKSLPVISINNDRDQATEQFAMAPSEPATRLEPLSLTNNEAQIARAEEVVTRLEPTRQADTNSEEGGAAYKQLKEILAGNGASVDWLRQAGLFDQFRSNNCHEHLSWSPDGTVNMAMRTPDGNRWTILCRSDGTNSQRVSDKDGRELVRFSSNGKIIDSLQRDRGQDMLMV